MLYLSREIQNESKKTIFLTFESLRHVHNISLATFCFGLLKIKTRQTKVFSYYSYCHQGNTSSFYCVYIILLRPVFLFCFRMIKNNIQGIPSISFLPLNYQNNLLACKLYFKKVSWLDIFKWGSKKQFSMQD